MCSSTRGPAIAPSLVTCPISSSAVPARLAWRVSCAAHSRTCATEPGADWSVSDQTGWVESITATRGRAERALLGRLLARHVTRLLPAGAGPEQERRLADAALAAAQRPLPRDQSAA